MSKPETTQHADQTEHDPPILAPGRNCWRVRRAKRVAFFVDAAEYYRALRAALLRARHSVYIVGWDFDGDIRLDPIDAPDESLAGLLARRIAERPELRVRILIWGFSTFYGANHQPAVSLTEPWHARIPQIDFIFDGHYPLGASHHEKIVTVDDTLAFVGGIDLTAERWDTPTHDPTDPRRCEHDGTPYEPVHDLQMAVDGEAGRAVSVLVHRRWRDVTQHRIGPVAVHCDAWPPEVQPALRDAPVAIARTRPAYNQARAIREVEALNLDALRAARRWIYLETQYLTAQSIGDAMERRLREPDGPEVLIVVTKESDGWIEQFAMGTNRERLLRRLKAADRFGRLRVYYPAVPLANGHKAVGVHSKLIIVDDRFARIGSSNFNNRSMGVDTECDLGIEAENDAAARAIADLRNRLLAEHVGAGIDAVAAATAETGSIIAAVERLNTGPRRLFPIEVEPDEAAAPLPGTAILDPEEPLNLTYLRQMLLSG